MADNAEEMDSSAQLLAKFECSSDEAHNQTSTSEIMTASPSTVDSLSSSPLTLSTLPPEIHLKLFDLLCPVNSTCLGLTCKKFYKIHHTYHGKVSLMTRSSSNGSNHDGRRLGYRIKSFFDRKLHFNRNEVGMYVTQKRAAELRKQRWDERSVVIDTRYMSTSQRAKYLKGFQSEDEEYDD